MTDEVCYTAEVTDGRIKFTHFPPTNSGNSVEGLTQRVSLAMAE